MQAAGVERRRGNQAGARQVFERCLVILLEEPDKNIHSHVSIKFARFLTMVSVSGAACSLLLVYSLPFYKKI